MIQSAMGHLQFCEIKIRVKLVMIENCSFDLFERGNSSNAVGCHFDIKTKKLRNSLGFNTSAFIVYVKNGYKLH